MSELKRLEFIKSADCDMGCDCRLIPDPVECKDGRFVFYSDYARLKAEVERLRASSFVTAVPVEQYERVVKAGDAMAEAMWYGDAERSIWVKKFAESDWNAAKEGKPSV